jgi:glycosyltransferase involved in cell wall biosynthesis
LIEIFLGVSDGAMRLYIAYADAPSLSVVANHVAKVARRAGHEVFMRTYPDLMEYRMLKAEGLLYIYPVNPQMAGRYAGFYSTQASYMPEESQLWYGTTEGTPWGLPASYPMWRMIRFVANSMYTASKLQEVEYRVVDIVHHGYDPDEMREALDYVEVLRRKVERDFQGRVIFSVVAGGHVRKGWSQLFDALTKLSDQVRQRVAVLAVAPQKVVEEIQKRGLADTVKVVGEFGKMIRRNVLAAMAVADYVIVPTLGEGFGMPLLEANALGKPAIHSWFQPLSEFSNKECNITFPYDDVKEVVDNGVEFELHVYDPEYLADAITRAIEIYGTADYDKMAAKCVESVKQMTIYELYPRLLSHLKA